MRIGEVMMRVEVQSECFSKMQGADQREESWLSLPVDNCKLQRATVLCFIKWGLCKHCLQNVNLESSNQMYTNLAACQCSLVGYCKSHWLLGREFESCQWHWWKLTEKCHLMRGHILPGMKILQAAGCSTTCGQCNRTFAIVNIFRSKSISAWVNCRKLFLQNAPYWQIFLWLVNVWPALSIS